MAQDEKTLPEPDAEARMNRLVDSLELVSARMFDTMIRTQQLASSTTPEMRGLFDNWVRCLEGEILARAAEKPELDIGALAKETGLAPTSVLSLLLALARQGKLDITHVKTTPGDGKNRERCDCM